jgi:hypothetical protein
VSDGCTSCGNKGGCNTRKGELFAALDLAMARLYPTGRWDQRDDSQAAGHGVAPGVAEALASEAGRRLGTLALAVPGDPGEGAWCDFVYVLGVGRRPSLIELREGLVAPAEVFAEAASPSSNQELYLRVALSALAPFAAVQEVRLQLDVDGVGATLTELPRSGVFDPSLLKRYRGLVAMLTGHGVRNVDFGEIADTPQGFEGGSYEELYGVPPATANFLFYPQPCTAVSTVLVPAP